MKTQPSKKIGKQTSVFANPPYILSSACIVGPKEGEGPLANEYDLTLDDELWGESTWEKAESKLVRETYKRIIAKSDKPESEIDIILSGDLLNQSIAATYGLRGVDIPFFGLYGACSTMSESLSLGAMIIDGGFATRALCITSSHFCSAERQFRAPLELGNQRTPGASWTVTGSGGVLLSSDGQGPRVTMSTQGKIVDLGVKDVSNMGAAMAPAAADTLCTHFKDTKRDPSYYDMIFTGDLGNVGYQLCSRLCAEEGYNLEGNYRDCGLMVFDVEKQDVHAGGSGCGCSASVLGGHIMNGFAQGIYKRVLFAATGALFSPTSSLQGESVPGICHAVAIEI